MEKLLPGDFILFHGEGFLSKVIEGFEDSQWSHAAYYTGSGYIVEAVEQGVRLDELAPILAAADKICVLRIPNLTEDGLRAMQAEAQAQVGDLYDYWHLVTMAPYYLLKRLGITWKGVIGDKSHEEICSEVCARCAAKANFSFCRDVDTVSPKAMYDCAGIARVWEGNPNSAEAKEQICLI